jgi:hypothetical protein
VGHSLGGGSIAYASEKFPTKISKAIYLSACMPSNGQSMFGAFPNTVNNFSSHLQYASVYDHLYLQGLVNASPELVVFLFFQLHKVEQVNRHA